MKISLLSLMYILASCHTLVHAADDDSSNQDIPRRMNSSPQISREIVVSPSKPRKKVNCENPERPGNLETRFIEYLGLESKVSIPSRDLQLLPFHNNHMISFVSHKYPMLLGLHTDLVGLYARQTSTTKPGNQLITISDMPVPYAVERISDMIEGDLVKIMGDESSKSLSSISEGLGIPIASFLQQDNLLEDMIKIYKHYQTDIESVIDQIIDTNQNQERGDNEKTKKIKDLFSKLKKVKLLADIISNIHSVYKRTLRENYIQQLNETLKEAYVKIDEKVFATFINEIRTLFHSNNDSDKKKAIRRFFILKELSKDLSNLPLENIAEKLEELRKFLSLDSDFQLEDDVQADVAPEKERYQKNKSSTVNKVKTALNQKKEIKLKQIDETSYEDKCTSNLLLFLYRWVSVYNSFTNIGTDETVDREQNSEISLIISILNRFLVSPDYFSLLYLHTDQDGDRRTNAIKFKSKDNSGIFCLFLISANSHANLLAPSLPPPPSKQVVKYKKDDNCAIM